MNDTKEARRLEAMGDWLGAAAMWKRAGAIDHAEGCELIACCNELGDAWRAQPEPRLDYLTFARLYKDGKVLKRTQEILSVRVRLEGDE